MKKVILIIVLLIVCVGGYFGWGYYQKLYANNIAKTGKLYIPTGASYNQVVDSIKKFVKDVPAFEWVAQQKKYPNSIKPGRYTITAGESNNALLNRLRIGQQDEIAVRIGNYSSIFELAGKMAPFLETDSAAIIAAIAQDDLSAGLDTARMLYFIMPETYNFHWNTSATQFVNRMKKQYEKFWTEERKQKAAQMNMTPVQVVTLASIVQLESAQPDEQPRVAGLYLNRLKIGMKLDADPTVIFAMKKASGFSQKIQRVYNKNLLIESPYNTYRYKGLPPGPICMPNPSAIDAVLTPAQHDYLYFVANPGKPGYHLYAKTLAEQEKNAAIYRQWLNDKNIK